MIMWTKEERKAYNKAYGLKNKEAIKASANESYGKFGSKAKKSGKINK